MPKRFKSMQAAARAVPGVLLCVLLANCTTSGPSASRLDPRYGVSSSPRVVTFGEPVPKGGGTYRVGRPYSVAGRTYVPEEDASYRAEGLASWYGDDFHGRLTANGEVFDMTSLTAAHPTLPIPSYARVTNVANGKSLIVRVNDRGPYHGNRLIDVSNRAAQLLEFQGKGVARVRVEYVGRAPLEGSDDRQLIATLRTHEPAPAPSAIRLASAQGFVPQLFTRGAAVPMPESRPYTLGNSREDFASAGASELSASSRPRVSRIAPENSRKVDLEPLPAPVSLSQRSASVAPRDINDLLVSGRALY